MSESATTLAVPLDSGTEERLARLAKARGTIQTALAAGALRLDLESEAWQVEEIKRGIEESDAGDFASETDARAVFAKWAHR